MLIAIYDVDYFCGKNSWNYTCMKISSYHKQMGDKVFLMETPNDLDGRYDIMYICRAKNNYPLPPIKFYGKDNIKIFGNCEYMNNYRVTDIILACRPDYSLYSKFKNVGAYHAEAIQLFNLNGKLLPKIQDTKNIYTKKRTLVIDESFWKSEKKDILEALSILKGKKNISFLFPISLKALSSDEEIEKAFFELDLSKGANLVWQYDTLETINAFTLCMGLICYGMLKKTAAKGTVLVDSSKWAKIEDLLYVVCFARRLGIIVQITKTDNIVCQYLYEYQQRAKKNESFVGYVLSKSAAKKYTVNQALTLGIRCDDLTTSIINLIGDYEFGSYCLVKWLDNRDYAERRQLVNFGKGI